MKVYVSHSSNFDYQNELYAPLAQEFGNTVEFYFPHDEANDGKDSRNIIESCDLVLAEASYSSTGQGIELGWASSRNIPILCVYKSGVEVSSAVKIVTNSVTPYSSTLELIDIVKKEV